MTLLATTPRITYIGDGVTTAFPVPFAFFGNDELQVIEQVIATGAEVIKTLTTHYTVSGGDGLTGTVTAVAAPAGTVTWTIFRKTKRTQEVDYTPNDPFPAETHERALDRGMAVAQELDDAVGRSAKLSPTSTLTELILPNPEADKLLGWKADLSGLENKTLPGGTAVYSSIANTRAGATAAEAVTPDGLASLWQKGADITAAGTLSKPADAQLGGYHVVTGNTTIAALWAGEVAGAEVELRFTGTPTLTHHATNLILPTGANIVAAAGDVARFRCEASGQWRVVSAPPSWYPAATVARKPIPRRQVILSGPVNTDGLSDFGGATGANTLTAAGTLVVAAAGGADIDGQIDRVGSIVNPQWTGLSTNGTMYLALDIAANGTCTPVATTVEPVEQHGGTPANTNNLFTFNISEMKGYLGTGSAAPQAWRVYVGQVTVTGAVVSAIDWYQVMARYVQPWVQNLPGTSAAPSANHKIGTKEIRHKDVELENTTTDQGYAVGDRLSGLSTNSGGSSKNINVAITTRLASLWATAGTGAVTATPKAGGAHAGLTQNSWKYRQILDRGW